MTVTNASTTASENHEKKSSLPVLAVIGLWTIAVIGICYFGRGLAGKILPRAEDVIWTTQVPIAANTTVTIRGWRHEEGGFTAVRPLTDCEISLNGSHVMGIGPNVTICHYTDHSGETIRGAAPPDEAYIAGWLKDAGELPTAAKEIAAKIKPLFTLNQPDLGPDWTTVSAEVVPELSYILGIAILVIVWGIGLFIIIFSASARRRRRQLV